jgi:HEAT repeat protein
VRYLTVLMLLAAAPALAGKGKLGSMADEDEAVPTPVKPGDDADRALLRGMLFCFEPAPTGIREIAVEDLGLLGDPRALNALAQLLMDPNPAVQSAALRAVSLIRHPRAEEILTNVVRHPTLSSRLKLAAIDDLVFQNTDTALTFLARVARGPNFDFALQTEARRALAEVPPQRLEARP